jgi:dihydrofolate reductase
MTPEMPVSKLLYSATMSLDGFIAGVGGDMSWLTEHLVPAASPEVDELLANIGALLVGKRTFTGDDPNKGTDAEGAFGGRWAGPSVVLTHDPPARTTDPDVTFVSDLTDGIQTAKDAARGKYVNVLGASVAKQCLEAGMLDEILVLIAPVLLGDGTRLFDRAGGTNVRLDPISQQVGSTSLWFRVAGRAV